MGNSSISDEHVFSVALHFTTWVKVIFYYSSKDKTLAENIYVTNMSAEEFLKSLENQDMTVDELQKETQRLLNKSLIQAWVKGYNSRFSKENWGNVKIKSAVMLEGE